MAEQYTRIRKVRRESYVKGDFTGQFQGKLDEDKSYRDGRSFYDIEVLRGTLRVERGNIRHYQFGEPDDFVHEELSITAVPSPLPAEVYYKDGRVKNFLFDLKDIKIRNYRLYHQIYEGDAVFGDIGGELSGYMLHYDEEVTIEVGKTSNEPGLAESSVNEDPSSPVKSNTTSPPVDVPPFTTPPPYTSPTQPRRESRWSLLRILLAILLLITISWAIWTFGWQALIPIGLLLMVWLLVTFSVGSALASLLLWFFRLAFLLLLFGIGFSYYSDWQKQKTPLDEPEPADSSTEDDPVLKRDSLIAHQLTWEDYAGNTYEGRFSVRSRYVDRARTNREELVLPIDEEQAYNSMMRQLHQFDREHLDSLYAVFDSIKLANQLSDSHFAEMIVSAVQSIPYVLMLPYECDARLYSDPFINRYLNSDGACIGNVDFGVHTPAEFVASLAGDCDTRTLFLYTVLDHFGYSVAVVGSTYWNHSLLAINLPYAGASTIINGRRYVLWETTEPKIIPGYVPAAQADMSRWTITLLSKN